MLKRAMLLARCRRLRARCYMMPLIQHAPLLRYAADYAYAAMMPLLRHAFDTIAATGDALDYFRCAILLMAADVFAMPDAPFTRRYASYDTLSRQHVMFAVL